MTVYNVQDVYDKPLKNKPLISRELHCTLHFELTFVQCPNFYDLKNMFECLFPSGDSCELGLSNSIESQLEPFISG